MPYLKEEKANIHRFISGLSITFKDRIEFDEPISLEEVIWKLNHCYEQSKCIYETKLNWKGNGRNKGKWDKKRLRPHDTCNKENAAPHKNFNASVKGRGFQFEE